MFGKDRDELSAMIISMKTLTVVGVVILAGAVWAQSAQREQARSQPQPALKTFTSPEGTFRLVYPELLIGCEQRQQSTGDGYYWLTDSCNGYGGVCDDAVQTGYIALVCLAYPRNKYTDTPAFEATAFSVGVVGLIANEADCLAGSTNWNVEEKGKAVTIGGVTFHVFRTSTAGMSQGLIS